MKASGMNESDARIVYHGDGTCYVECARPIK